MVKVSVIIAVYNSENYIKQTLDSIINQTLSDIEIICVDDGSVDNSLHILNEYASKDHRIKVIENKIQSDGAAMARNIGVQQAQGEYLSILDADDFFEGDMLEKVYLKAEETNAEIVIFNGWVYDEKIKSDVECDFILRTEYMNGIKSVVTPKEISDRLFILTIGAAWNCLFKKELIDRENIKFKSYHHADDLGFVYLAFSCAKSICVLNERLLHYRRNLLTSQAANIDKWPETAYLSLLDLKNELVQRDLFETFKESFVQKSMEYIIFYLDGMNNIECFKSLYGEIKNTYLSKLSIDEVSDEKFKNSYWALMKNVIANYSCEEYLFRRLKSLEPFGEEVAWKELVSGDDKVAVYGAGRYGTDMVNYLLREKKDILEAWVDKNYEKLGYPVMNPESLKDISFDYVVVAIISKNVFKTVKDYLINMGICENKIKWIGKF